MVVQGSSFNHKEFPASNVLILGKKDEWKYDRTNYWLGGSFTLKVDDCARMIVGCQIKNLGEGDASIYATKEFQVSGSNSGTGDWEILVEDQLIDSRNYPASLINFHFKEPVEFQFLKFELVSYWGTNGGGLQYFAAIPEGGPTTATTGEYLKNILQFHVSVSITLNPNNIKNNQNHN